MNLFGFYNKSKWRKLLTDNEVKEDLKQQIESHKNGTYDFNELLKKGLKFRDKGFKSKVCFIEERGHMEEYDKNNISTREYNDGYGGFMDIEERWVVDKPAELSIEKGESIN